MSDLGSDDDIPEAPPPIPLHRYLADYRPANIISEDIDDDLPPMSSQPTLLNARNMQRLQQHQQQNTAAYTLPRAVILNPNVDINTLTEEERKQIYDYNSNRNNIIMNNRNISGGNKKRKRNTKKHSKKIRKYKRRKTRK